MTRLRDAFFVINRAISMHTQFSSLVAVTRILGIVLVAAPLALSGADLNAKSTRKLGPRNKQITASEYDALKQEISNLKAQVEILMKNTAGSPNAALQKAPASSTEHAETEHAKPAPSSAAVAQQPATASAPAGPGASSPTLVSDGLAEGDRKQEAEEAQRQLDTFLRSQKLLFKKGQLQGELDAGYTYDMQSNSCTGNPPLTCVKDKSGLAVIYPRVATRSGDLNFVARYGVLDNVEFDLQVPVSYLEQESSYQGFVDSRNTLLVPALQRTESVGIGDIAGTLRYALWREDGTWPDVTLSLDVKSPTGDSNRRLGTGFWNLGGSVTMVKTIDPVVLFGSLGYVATLEARGIDPGDQIPYTFGMGFSLNDRVSFRISLSGSTVRHTEVNWQALRGGSGLDVSTLQFSTTIQKQKNLFFEPFVGFGLTEDAPDFIAGLRIPYRFSGNYPLPFFN
jgi:hypothetical protein